LERVKGLWEKAGGISPGKKLTPKKKTPGGELCEKLGPQNFPQKNPL